MKKVMIYFIPLLLLYSCNKEESELWTEIHVKATDYNTGEPLDDVYIGIIEWKDKWLFDSKGKSISEGYTDANGEYHFEWKAKHGDGFLMNMSRKLILPNTIRYIFNKSII